MWTMPAGSFGFSSLPNTSTTTHIRRHMAFGGPIPAELGNLTKLEHLDLARNALTGSIPPELGNLANLTELWLQGNLPQWTDPPRAR